MTACHPKHSSEGCTLNMQITEGLKATKLVAFAHSCKLIISHWCNLMLIRTDGANVIFTISQTLSILDKYA